MKVRFLFKIMFRIKWILISILFIWVEISFYRYVRLSMLLSWTAYPRYNSWRQRASRPTDNEKPFPQHRRLQQSAGPGNPWLSLSNFRIIILWRAYIWLWAILIRVVMEADYGFLREIVDMIINDMNKNVWYHTHPHAQKSS